MNRAKCFKKSETLYTAFYYSDQDANMTTHMKIIQPNGNIWSSWSHTSPSYYNCSLWYWYFTLPSNGPFGTWLVEAEFNGQTYQEAFLLVDETCPDCELEYIGATALSGNVSSPSDYKSYGVLESSQIIQNETIYSSDRFSLLLPSFEVGIGANLTIEVNQCISD